MFSKHFTESLKWRKTLKMYPKKYCRWWDRRKKQNKTKSLTVTEWLNASKWLECMKFPASFCFFQFSSRLTNFLQVYFFSSWFKKINQQVLVYVTSMMLQNKTNEFCHKSKLHDQVQIEWLLQFMVNYPCCTGSTVTLSVSLECKAWTTKALWAQAVFMYLLMCKQINLNVRTC